MCESDDLLKKKPKRHGRWLVLATLAVLVLCSTPFVWRYYRVAAVQNTLVRNYEISFEYEEAPGAVCQFFEEKLRDLLSDREFTLGEQQPRIVYPERVRAMFLGKTTEIGIYYPEGFRGDLGAALLRFGELKKFTVFENEPHAPTEADYKLLCQRLRDLPALEDIELGGAQISSDTVAPLAGHPSLKKLHLSYSTRLTTDVLHTLKALPALQNLKINSIYGPDEDEWKSRVLHVRFRKELPGVTLILPEP